MSPPKKKPDASTGAFQADAGTSPIGGSAFPPIGDYAFLSDCETNCLIAPSGAVEWMCVPRPDSPSVFGAVLDRGAGSFRVGPYDELVPAARRYLPGSLMAETTWQTRTGWLIVRDALCMGPWHNLTERSKTHRRSPTDFDAEHCLLRTVKCVSGTVELSMTCDPMFAYGLKEATWEYEGTGYGQMVATAPGEDLRLRITTDLRPGIERRSIKARTRMVEGDERFVALSWSTLPAPTTFEEATHRMARTSEHWRQWITEGDFPDHRWRSYLQRSALTLKGLTYAPTGALLAAATTSLPETPHGERNWDYRFAWVRDSTFALWGLYTLGFDREADDFFYFIGDACHGHDLQIMYGVGGERDLTERTLPHLSGYEGASPVRVGNGAYNQKQHDVWGAVLDSVLLHARSRSRLQESMWPILEQQVEVAAEHWEEPDRGIWEVRGEPQHFTSSKMMCWVALDRGARLARMYEKPDYAEKWQALADQIHADICTRGVDERGVFVQHYGSNSLDASLLLMPLLRFLPPDDPRIQATVLAIADELTEDGLVLRYRTEETSDGLHGHEGTFTICSFWLVSALVEIGELDRGRRLCERLLSLASPLELYAEEIDPRTGRHLGNFPQAFTHLALVNAVMHVIRAEEAEAEVAVNVHGNPVTISVAGHPTSDQPDPASTATTS
ncbi:MAG TPA: glycoside hydrolase family 15 protein [Acidimicrobiales bacterium]|nr:glycoside hydrolase family 15 protein [Acidimicrobiales bacterium]